jgi:glycerate-2-kinase
VQVLEAGHPVPDAMGLVATDEVLRLAREAGEDDLVVCLLSGGASALLERPPDGITLEDLQKISRLLLSAGAGIEEFNTIRRHLSLVKGGRLARAIAPARCATLVISDVIGDSPATIASGPTVPDPTTFADAWTVIAKLGLAERAPQGVIRYLQDGVRGVHAESPKSGDAHFLRCTYHVLANNGLALQAAADQAGRLGYRVRMVDVAMAGEAREVGASIAATVREELGRALPDDPPFCLLWGGETTVTVHGTGSGGRNQELALAAFGALRSTSGALTLAALGTDGVDGPTDAAGAWFDAATLRGGLAPGLIPEQFLAENNSHEFFERLGGLIRTGPTGTNVADIVVALGA